MEPIIPLLRPEIYYYQGQQQPEQLLLIRWWFVIFSIIFLFGNVLTSYACYQLIMIMR